MKLTTVAFAAACLVNVALAVTLPLNAESLQSALGDLFGSIDAEVASFAANSVAHKRSLLQASSSGASSGTGSVAASAAASALGSMSNTLSGLFNHDWQNEFSPDALKNLNWTQLGTWQNTTPLQDVIENNKISLPNLSEIEEQVENLTSSFCTPASCTESKQKPATCVGPSVSLILVPHTCVQEDSWDYMAAPTSYSSSSYSSSSYSPPAQPKQAPVCTPAQLLLVKTPGKCTLKRSTPASYTGKSCIYQKTFGFSKTEVYGGDTVSVPIKGAEAPLSSAIASAAATAVSGNSTGSASGK